MSMLDKAVTAVREQYADDHGEEDYQRIAIAVLQAIREPDGVLLQPGCSKHKPGQPMSGRYDVECPTFVRRRRIWTEQIDAILQGGE